ncbi:tyrosine-type recombinase/integrase [Sphingoaurantiacus capsulatus]|uniref:Tyrosine-type recombinase/integrase n=1 Tax=Sphingoaurantiacus capsulatus TaxID=1771310 RepID=A0ABV7X7B1_9SPHN
MPAVRITKRAVDEMPLPQTGATRSYLWDDRLKGFGVMATAGGAKSYIVQYRIGGRGGQTRRVTIGGHGSPWTAERARERAHDILEDVRKGIDPFEAQRVRVEQERAAKRNAADAKVANERLNFASYADSYLSKYARVRQKPNVARETQGIIERDLKPFFKDKLISQITPADALALIDKVQERSNSAALKVYRTMSTLFGWAASRHDISDSPIRNLKPPHVQPSRDRVLSDDELRAIWDASEDHPYPYGSLVRLLALTGQRLREVANMTWDEVDLNAGTWTVPGARTKNGATNIVPLSDGAMVVLRSISRAHSEKAREQKRADFVFTTTGKSAFSGFSKLKKRFDASVHAKLVEAAKKAGGDPDAVKLKPWRLHDLRRTMATGLQRLGVRLEVTEAVLNHVSGSRSGIIGIYQRHNYLPEKRNALEKWSRLVFEILAVTGAGHNVVRLRKQRSSKR